MTPPIKNECRRQETVSGVLSRVEIGRANLHGSKVRR